MKKTLHHMPGRGVVKSMTSLQAQAAYRTHGRGGDSLLSGQVNKDFARELQEEQERLQKAMTSSSYLSECMKNIFALPNELAQQQRQAQRKKNTVREVQLLSSHIGPNADEEKKKKTFMTGLERRDQVIELFVPDAPEESPAKETGTVEKPVTIGGILEELESTQKQLREENDDLAELRRRVDLTEKNMYYHMHSVGTIRHCLDDVAGAGNKKSGVRNSRLQQRTVLNEKLLNFPKLPPVGGNKWKDIAAIKAEVDKELGIKPEGKIRRVTMSKQVKPPMPATKERIMSSLINMTGRMAEFSKIIGQASKGSISSKLLPLRKPY